MNRLMKTLNQRVDAQFSTKNINSVSCITAKKSKTLCEHLKDEVPQS